MAAIEAGQPRTGGKSGARRARRHASLIVGLGLLGSILVLSLLVNLVSPYSVTGISLDRLQGVSSHHWFGTDDLGRDLFTRSFDAARSTLLVSALATAAGAAIGVPVGLFSGYRGGRIDTFLMRAIDVLFALPPVILALAVIVIFKPGMLPLIIALTLVFVPFFARVARGPVLSLRERGFVSAAKVAGVSEPTIICRHVLPNVLGPIFVQFANTASLVVILEASLSYLGFGVQPPNPSWGGMVADARQYMTQDPMMILAPGLLIILTSIAWNLIADGLQNISGDT